jgi:hypothetical protein
VDILFHMLLFSLGKIHERYCILAMVGLALRALPALHQRILNQKLNLRSYYRSYHRKSPVLCQQQRGNNSGSGGVENVELLIGDMLAQVSFATYKQIIAIALSPQFKGWLAPLHFNPIRFEEFFSFVVTICGTWAAAGILLGAYTNDASADVRSALVATCRVWLCSMCIAAAQLVLVTAAEDGALVGTEGWGRALPLAASLPGEPFISAAQILGLMLIWRSFYAAYLDMSKFLKFGGARLDKETEAQHFKDALTASIIIAAASCLCLHFLSTG